MLFMRKCHALAILWGVLALATLAEAQSTVLDLPRASQHATVMQRLGVTDITINYHRPLVAGRKIWDGIVPYGQVWRAGANENTTISFSDPVTVEGKPLDRGTYGLHMVPGPDQWTIIFSKVSSAWGSFTYKEAEDALRVTVKPQASEFREALSYDFDQVKPDAALAVMRWEKVAVPFNIGVNVSQTVQESLHKQLRGLPQYTWEAWDDAANYYLAQKTNLDEALKDEEQSIKVEERFENLLTKSRILDQMGRKDEAKTTLAKALDNASPIQLHVYARQLQGEKRPDEAFAIFRSNYKKHPDQWFVHSGMARIYSAQGDYDSAVKEMKVAAASAPDNAKSSVEGLVKRLENKQDINK
jgi:tetratricopeptide (TPR) repeat protein